MVRNRRWEQRRRAGVLGVLALVTVAACVQVGSEPDVPAAIELTTLPSPSVVIGDTMRNIDGVASPVVAIVRNLAGDVIADAPVQYLYADFARDSALDVDPSTGLVVAVKAATGTARLAARVGSSLQVLRNIAVVKRPDSTDRIGQSDLALFTTTFPDTGRTGASANSSPALTVVVRNVDTTTQVATTVASWLVQFELVSPANATNDTTQAVFLVDDVGRASTIDTTDGGGVAGRKVRIRAAQFPAPDVTDSVIVRAIVTYRGQPLRGAPVRMALPVQRGS